MEQLGLVHTHVLTEYPRQPQNSAPALKINPSVLHKCAGAGDRRCLNEVTMTLWRTQGHFWGVSGPRNPT